MCVVGFVEVMYETLVAGNGSGIVDIKVQYDLDEGTPS